MQKKGSAFYLSVLREKLKEVLTAIVPITIIVLLMNFTVTPIDNHSLLKFLLGAGIMIVGLTMFLHGIDVGITPIGHSIGPRVVKFNKVWIIAATALIVGFFITIAEPDLQILAGQVDAVTGGAINKFVIIAIVSIGTAIMLAVGFLRTLYNVPLYICFNIIYGIIFIMSLFTSSEFLAIAFDASGATTGAFTVPFTLALAMGISSINKNSIASEEDSFGLVGLASTGAIVAAMALGFFSKDAVVTSAIPEAASSSSSVLATFAAELPEVAWNVFLTLFPISVIFIVFQHLFLHLGKRVYYKILIGLLYTFFGMVLFLWGVNTGFMNVGAMLGNAIASFDNKIWVVIMGFVFGIVTIIAEPAVYVLMHQVEEVTSGHVKKSLVMIAICAGVGIAVALSILKIVIPGLQLWHYLLPGYLISLALTFFAPKLFVGIAFDSGGVASGPMCAAFILAFTQGAAEAVHAADVLRDGFGVIALVSMVPIITLQILGIIFKLKSRKGGKESNE